ELYPLSLHDALPIFDRELRLAGRLALADGRVVLADTGPLLRLPQLAIHLERDANSGLTLDAQAQTQPVWGLGDPTAEDLLGELRSEEHTSELQSREK